MTPRRRRSWSTLLLAAAASSYPCAASVADEKCAHPPPVFHCEDWREDAHGHLVARRDVAVGLMPIEEGHYIGGGIRIAGHDYGELLRRRCAPERSFWRRWFGGGR